MEQGDVPSAPADVSQLIAASEAGDAAAREALFAGLYAELRRLAKRELARSGAQVTLSATALLHEAYLDIAGRQGTSFPDRARFMAYAARVMRGLIIDHARMRRAQKRGGQFEITALATEAGELVADDRELSRLSDALEELAQVDPTLTELVDLKFFCGFTFGEIAAMRGVAERTVQRGWEKARIYLYSNIKSEGKLPFPDEGART
jgi:RNA polymerase sigma factor (TIGR02999 family)